MGRGAISVAARALQRAETTPRAVNATLTPAGAQVIAERAHAGVVDRLGIPYIQHVSRVAATVPEFARTVAWLHDTVEDTSLGYQQLQEAGLSREEMQALWLLTREKASGLTYMEYIVRLANAEGYSGKIARQVKLADLRDNQSRPTPVEMAGIEKRYRRAQQIVEQELRERGESVSESLSDAKRAT